MPEFWELTDAEIWGLVDGDWLMRQFRRSEQREVQERKAALHGGSVNWERLGDAFARAALMYASYVNAFRQAVADLQVGITASEAAQLEASLRGLEQQCRRQFPEQRHTLRSAFQVQAHRGRNTHARQRRHQVQHRG